MTLQEFKKEVKTNHPELFIKSTARGIWMIAHAWFVIIGAVYFYSLFPNLWIGLLAVMVIGSRQLGISILMHEAAHRTLVNGKGFNNFLGSWFCSLPVIYSLRDYRNYHLEHHWNTQQSDDPDLHLSKKFPVSPRSMARKFGRDIFGLTGLKLRYFQLKGFIFSDERMTNKANSLIKVIFSQFLIFTGFTLLFSYEYYFYFWLLPLLTWFQFITRVRNIAEHAMVQNDDDPLLHARHINANILERIFLAPYYVNYHLEHHLLMSLPCYNFKNFYQILLKKFGRENLEIKHSYFDVLKLATKNA